MGSSNAMLLISIRIYLLLVLTPLISGQFGFRNTWCGDESYTPNSTYQSNLNTVLTALSSDTQITYGFYNFTAGQAPNKVSSLVTCRGDVPLATCRVCVNNSAQQLPQACPGRMVAFGYSEYCTMFVSNNFTYGTVQDSPQFELANPGPSVSDVSAFNRSLQGLLNNLINQAASGGAERKYAAGQTNITGNGGKLYGLVQCTPDLDRRSCVECVREVLLPNFTGPSMRSAAPSCYVQYDVSPFFGNVPNVATPPPLTTSPSASAVNRRRKSSNASTIMIPIPIVGLAVFIIGATIWVLLKRRKSRKSRMRFSQEEIESLKSLQFSFGMIKQATEDFKEDNKLGQGGFGTVYKGTLSNGDKIAVKRLLRSSGSEGDVQFKNEILILAKLHHRNLVKLLGFCLHEEEMLLIYEVVANGSLDKFLFDPIQREHLLWETRSKIISGTARGLLYLHEESRLRIIHRDLKAGNVLLDTEFNPKIADFGMARLFNIDQTQTMTSRIAGTYGYMPPEYVLYGQVSVKSDVYSFGVLVLEIISGQRISSFVHEEDPEDLLSFAWRNWMAGTAWNIVDATLSDGFSTEILRCTHIGLLCVQDKPEDRPTMSSVGIMLSSHTLALPVPSPPAYYVESNNARSNEPLQGSISSGRSIGGSVNAVSITELHPR
ncbi:hypothetical protein Cgig2_000259 [Carnegiea gigantea]|uniref:Cysteine-rich receptor-like protein kinase 10 n=1 Tax=Carnegiea gigantea TaxID=171969 RepID=A0A9Q1GRD0_9CARY|nr:hypothetical protein Cgig2_000259 [Carnegiea gigantea]